MKLYTPEEIEHISKHNVCPFWNRLTPAGTCVPKWWAGGPVSTAITAFTMVFSVALAGIIVARSPVRKWKAEAEKVDFNKNLRPRRKNKYRS